MQKPYQRICKYAGRRLAQDTSYSVMYLRVRFPDQPPTASIHIRSHRPQDDHRQQGGTIRLNRLSLPAGTLVSDAITLLSLAVPSVYRDLWHSIIIDERHSAEWEGERKA